MPVSGVREAIISENLACFSEHFGIYYIANVGGHLNITLICALKKAPAYSSNDNLHSFEFY